MDAHDGRAVGNGKTFVVTRGGRPVGELRPLRRDRFIDAVAVVDVFRNAPAVNWKQIRDDLDALVDHINGIYVLQRLEPFAPDPPGNCIHIPDTFQCAKPEPQGGGGRRSAPPSASV